MRCRWHHSHALPSLCNRHCLQDCAIQTFSRSSVAPRGPPLIIKSTCLFAQHENEEVVGRIDSRLSLPGRLLYPRYFHSEIGPGQMVPGTLGHKIFHRLHYIGPQLFVFPFACLTVHAFAATGEQASAVLWGSIDKQSRPDALQQSDMWPIPAKASWPHSAPWAEFLRPVAPGVYCSCTWVHPNDLSKARCVSHAILVKSDSQ